MASHLSLKHLVIVSFAAGGCAQILGLSDYDIDPNLDAAAGGEATGEGGDGGTGSGGKSQGGEPTGGTDGEGGEPATAGGPSAGGAGGAALGELVPCDSQDCCDQEGGTAVGVEVLQDGGFELGTFATGDTPWTEVSTNGVEIITNDTTFGFDPRTGEYFAYLSGIQGERSTLYSEDFIVPDDAGWIVVSGYRLFQIDTQDDLNMDFCGVGFYGPAAEDLSLVELPFLWTNPSASADGWGNTPTWRVFEASWDALPHQGEKRHLGLRGESDSYSMDPNITSSSYLFDDISLKVFRCYM